MLARLSIGSVMLVCSLALADDSSELPDPLQWTINGEKREAIVMFPNGPRKKAVPVVFVFHGHGSTMEAFARHWRIQKHWPEAIAVYMQGLPTPSRVDPKGKRSGWQSKVGTQKNRDLKFVDAVLKTLHKKHAIDDDRIYATGFSNGGVFTYVLWSARPDVFAAFAPGAGVLYPSEDLTLKPAALMHIAGEKDNTAPFDMQLASMATVRKINGCKVKAVEWESDCKLYPPKTKTGAPFVSLIHSGGHSLPRHGVELIVKFFKEHPRNGARAATSQ